MSRTLWLMRHGTTLFNARHKIQGWCDSPLTAYGRAQAAWMGEWFADNGVTFDHAYCSTAGRTAETLELATRGAMPYERLEGVREYYFGLLEGERDYLPAPDPFGEFLVQFGGESTAQVRERMVATITEVMSRPDHDCVLVVSHGSSGLAFYDAFAEASAIDLGGKLPPRASAIRYSFDDGAFRAEQLVCPDESAMPAPDGVGRAIHLDGLA